MTVQDWIVIIPLFFTSLATCIVSIVTAVRTKEVRRQVTPPTNGHTLGTIAESISAASDVTAALRSPAVLAPVRSGVGPHRTGARRTLGLDPAGSFSMTALGISLIGVGILLVVSAVQDYPGSPHGGGPVVTLGRAFRGQTDSGGNPIPVRPR